MSSRIEQLLMYDLTVIYSYYLPKLFQAKLPWNIKVSHSKYLKVFWASSANQLYFKHLVKQTQINF